MPWGHYHFPHRGLSSFSFLGRDSEASLPTSGSRFFGEYLDALLSVSSTSPSQKSSKGAEDRQGRLENLAGVGILSECRSLALETDPELFFQQALRIAQGLERDGRQEAALLLFEKIAQTQDGEFAPSLAVRDRALAESRAIRGLGGSGMRVEYLLKRFARETSDPWMIVGFGAGSLAFKAVRLGVLSRLAGGPARGLFSQPLVAGLVSSAAGLGAEVPAFVLTSKLGRELVGLRQDWSAGALSHELAATGVTLFSLKAFGVLSGRAVGGLRGASLNGAALPEIGALSRFAQSAAPQLGMFGGIVFSRRLEESLGLRPKQEGDTLLVDSLSTYFQFLIGGHLAERALGPRFLARQRELDWRASNIRRGPFFEMPSGALAISSRSAGGRRLSLQELMNAPLFSKNHDDNGNSSQPSSRPRPVSSEDKVPTDAEARELAKLHDPKVFAEEIREQIRSDGLTLKEAMSALRVMGEKVRTYMVHTERGRASAPEMNRYREEIQVVYDRFLRRYLESSRRYHASIPLATAMPGLQGEVLKSRAEVQRFLEGATRVHLAVQNILGAVAAGDSLMIQEALSEFYRKIPGLTGKPQHGVSLADILPREEVLFSQLAGIFQGISAKEVYRGSAEEIRLVREFQLHPWNLLSLASPRAQDPQITSWLISEMRHHQGLAWDPADTLIVRHYPNREESPDSAIRSVSPRELLRWGGDYESPFRTWIGVQLPTLFAAYAGDLAVFSDKTVALELFMERDTREATRLAAWWLDKAVNGRGFPSEWALESSSPIVRRARRLSLGPSVDIARAERELGADGDLAAVGHAVLAFLRHPFEPRAALELALQAPEAIREDAASLTGALQGAFHGRGAFPLEWMAGVVLNSIPGRGRGASISQVTDFINLDLQYQNTLQDLAELTLRRTEGAKVTPLRAVMGPEESPSWRAFRAGYEERFHKGEMVALEALWEGSLFVEQAQRVGIPPERRVAFRNHLEAWIRTLSASRDALSEFRSRSEASLIADLGEAAGMRSFDDFLGKLGKVEATLRALRQLRGLLDRDLVTGEGFPIGQERLERWRAPLAKATAVWGIPGLSAASGSNEALPLDGIRALRQGAMFIGPSQGGDLGIAAAVIQNISQLEPAALPTVENLMESYLLTVAASYVRRPGVSLAEQIAPNELFAVLTPAFLEVNRGNPIRAMRELTTLPTSESPETREAWRLVTYAALRLLQGAKPDLAFVQELRRSFVDSPMVQSLSALIELQVGVDFERHDRILLDWEESHDLRARALLGLHAFLQAPSDAKSAIRFLHFSAVDPYQVAERVAGMLAELHRFNSNNLLVSASSKMLTSDWIGSEQANDAEPVSERRPMNENDIAMQLGRALDPQAQGARVEIFWREWATALGVKLDAAELQSFADGMRTYPPYFHRKLSYYSVAKPELAKALLFKLNLLPPKTAAAAEPELRAALSAKVRDQSSSEDWEDFSKSSLWSYEYFGKGYFPEKFRPLSESERLQWHEAIGDLPPLFAEALTTGGLQSSVFMLLAERLGLSKLGIPDREDMPVQD